MKVKLFFLSAALILGALTSCQKTDLSGVEKGISDANAQIEKLQSDLDAVSASLGQLAGKATADSLRARVSALETSLTTVQETLAKLQQTVGGLSSAGEEVKDELETIQAEILLLAGAIEELSGQVGGSLVQSIVFVPRFIGGGAVVEHPDSIVLTYAITPATTAKTIADSWTPENHKILEIATRAITLRAAQSRPEITAVTFDGEDSLLNVTLDIKPIGNVIFSKDATVAVSLKVNVGGASVTSAFTDVNAAVKMCDPSDVYASMFVLNGYCQTLVGTVEKEVSIYLLEGEETSIDKIKANGDELTPATFGQDGKFSTDILTGKKGETVYSCFALAKFGGKEMYSNVHQFKTPSYPEITSVDLGLSVKWASYNMGASKPEDFGDYYSFAALQPFYQPGEAQKEAPVWKPGFEYGYSNESARYCPAYAEHPIKYNDDDEKIYLDPEDDIAFLSYGGEWRIPVDEDWDELKDPNNCTWTRTTISGVSGYMVVSKANSASIFLPAAGCRDNLDLESLNYSGRYMSSIGGDGVRCLKFDDSDYWLSSDYRRVGFSVRPVCGPLPEPEEK